MSQNDPKEKQPNDKGSKINDLNEPRDNESVESDQSPRKDKNSIQTPPDDLPPRVPVREPQRKPPALMKTRHRRASGIF